MIFPSFDFCLLRSVTIVLTTPSCRFDPHEIEHGFYQSRTAWCCSCEGNRPQSNVSSSSPRVHTFSNDSHSIYCKNLPDQLPKDDLKRNLYMLFATYGVVLDVIALKTSKMRGQAHVVFRDIDSSTQAMRALQGFNFFGKEMVSLLVFSTAV